MKRAGKAASARVAELGAMSLAELRAEWQRRYGLAPRHRAAELIRRVLAWRIQADIYGGLDAPTRRLLERDHLPAAATPSTGMRLAREWAGRRYEVTIIDAGVVYDGKTYRSLSEVARHITGQRWNGPRFFGLRQANVR